MPEAGTIADARLGEPTPARPAVSAAVITRNRAELLARTLPTVLAQDLSPGSFEVIVVDDGSSDGTPRFLAEQSARLELQVLRQAPRGVSAARNAALEAARGELVVFLDDDLLCERGLLRAHATAHERSAHPLIVVGRLGIAPESPSGVVAGWLAGATDAAHARRARRLTLRDTFVAANCSVPLKLVRSCGGFDESFVNDREEHELGLRLVRAGARPLYEPRAVALEVVRKPVEQFLGDARAVGRAEVRLSRRYPEYRPHSQLARLAEGTRWKAAARRLTTRSRLVETVFLATPARLAAAPGGTSRRRAAVALVGARHGVAVRRGAVEVAGSWRALEEEFGRRLPVLAYPRLAPAAEAAGEPAVTPRVLRRHLALVRRLGYTPIASGAWLAWCRSAAPLPGRPVLLTFDAADPDLSRYVLPSVADDGFPATLCAYGRAPGRLPASSPDELTAELAASRQELERRIRAPVTTFAYPSGPVDERAREAAAATFDAAFTTEEGLNTLATDPLLLRRSVVSPTDTALDVYFRLRLGWSPLHRLGLRLARRRRSRRGS